MHRIGVHCSLALACITAQAQDKLNPDLMKTPACVEARGQLDDVLARGGPRDRLDDVRQQAALKCLGVKAPPVPEGRFVPPPAAVDPIRLRAESALGAAATARPPAPAVTPPQLPVAVPRPPVLTTCDPSGCWDANGARYHQQGPLLVGPQGLCSRQGGSLNCP